MLGFIVSQKGIEVDLDKVKAILEIPEPRTEKQVRGFLGRLNYIARFISQLTALASLFLDCCVKISPSNGTMIVK